MTAVGFGESTKYGARLFAYLLVSVVVGGILFGLGWTLAWPGVLAVLPGPPVVEDRAEVAAGIVLGVLGVYVGGTGLLATVNKFVADSVSQAIDATDLEVEVDAEIDPGSTANTDAVEQTGGREDSPADDTGGPGSDPSEPVAKSPAQGDPATSERGDVAPPEEQNQRDPSKERGEIDASGEGDKTESPGERGDTEPAVAEAPAETEATTEPEPLESRATRVVREPAETSESAAETAEQLSDDSPEPPDAGSLGADREEVPREPSPEEIAFGTTEETDGETDTGASGSGIADEPESGSESEESRSVEPAGSSSSGDPLAEPTDDE